MTSRRWSPFLVDPKIAQISEYVGLRAPMPRGSPLDQSLCQLLAVIPRYCWLFLAVILLPVLAKKRGFLRLRPEAWLFFAGLSAI
jgi:hypothetical protein